MKPRQNILLVGLLMVAILATVTGCTISDKQLLVVLVEEWTRSKNMNPTNEDGSIDLIGAGNALLGVVRNAAGVSTGDDEIDAILNAKKVLDNFSAAEKLIEGAQKRGTRTRWRRPSSCGRRTGPTAPSEPLWPLSRAISRPP